jgi:hypothetical protein
VWLRVVFDSLSAQSDGLSFRCDDGGRALPCGIADTALRDLIDFHRVKSNERTALRTLVSEIERLVNAKSDAGRFEENGCIIIWLVDLLRYGYQSRETLAA